MAMTEAPFSLTIKVGPNNDLLTGRAETAEEMAIRIEELHLIRNGWDVLQGSTQAVAAAPAPAPTYAPEPNIVQAVANVQAAGMVAPGGIETRDDQWGNQFMVGMPDAGFCNHGPRVVKNGTNKAGKRYKAFVCVNDSPFREGKYDKSAICEIAWPAKA